MSTCISQQTCSLSADGQRFVFRGVYDADVVEFYRTLPGAKWDRVSRVWTCRLTPAAAMRCWAFGLNAETELLGPRFRQAIDAAHARFWKAYRAEWGWQPDQRAFAQWPHQRAAYHFAQELPGCLLPIPMGGGKTKVAIDLLMNSRTAVRNVLILCPTSVRAVWRGEFHKHGPSYRLHILDNGTVRQKRQWVEQDCEDDRQHGDPSIVVVNYESAWRAPLGSWILERDWDWVILDESHRIKAHNSSVSKFCAKLHYRAKRRLCLTGTPMPHSPMDLFGQFRFLDPGVFGDSWFQFRSRYAETRNPNIPQQITGFINQEEMRERMAWITSPEVDCKLGLPPARHEEVTYAMTPGQRKVYEAMERELCTELEGGVVTAANALVKLLRLQQVIGGWLTPDDSDIPERVDPTHANAKRETLIDMLEDLPVSEPVVVFAWFRADLDEIQQAAATLGRRYGELSGRSRGLTDDGKLPDDVDLLGVQCASGGLGVDLSRASYAVMYSLGNISPGSYDQILARLVRPGQRRPVLFWHLLAENTIDQYMYRARAEKRDAIDYVLSALRNPESEEELNEDRG